MPESGWIEAIITILKFIFGDQIPIWLVRVIGVILLVLLILASFLAFIYIAAKVISLIRDTIWPALQNPEEKRRINRRRNFARNLLHRIRDLNTREDWTDYHFTELEAEVEVEGQMRPILSWLRFIPSWSGKRRVRSLTRALEISVERILLLEGDPGSGKSVALRHLAINLLERASKSGSTESKVPLYINLKELRRGKNQKIDATLIENFILDFLTSNSNRDDEDYLDEEFKRCRENGSWLFIFDSFDEIPDVLSAIEANEIIRQYATAIFEFLHGQNLCRGIIASRQFRGPGHVTWPRLKITPLSSDVRKHKLIRQANLSPQKEKYLIAQLRYANQDIQNMASNPMFLGLLCQHIYGGYNIPQDAHTLFESYINRRLNKDKERIRKHFGLDIDFIRKTAEDIAFCMTAEKSGLGLTPTRQELDQGMVQQGLEVKHDFQKILDALEYLKLARYGKGENRPKGEGSTFTFAHRRFQEYFATCVVLREPDRITEKELLLNARWRETVVVLCQTQPITKIQPLVQEILEILNTMIKSHSSLLTRSVESLLTVNENKEQTMVPFAWPEGCLHVIGIMQAGFGNRLKDLPNELRQKVGRILLCAFKTGGPFDRRWALEIIGAAPERIKIALLESAVKTPSAYLRDVVYKQLGWLGKLSPSLLSWIRSSLVRQAMTAQLAKHWQETQVLLSRLSQSTELKNTTKLLRVMAILDFVVMAILIAPNLVVIVSPKWYMFLINIILIVIAYLLVWKASYLSKFSEGDQPSVQFMGVFISACLRFTAAWIASVLFAVFIEPTTTSVVDSIIFSRILLVLLAASMLVFGGFISCLDGVFCRNPFLWVFVPLSPFSLLITEAIKLYKSIPRLLRLLKKRVAVILIYCIVSLIIPILILNLVFTSSPPTKTSPDSLGTVAFGVLFGGYILIGIMFLSYRFIKLTRLKKHLSQMVVQEMVILLIKNALIKTAILRYIRRKNLLIANINNETALIYLILLVDNTIKKNKARIITIFNYFKILRYSVGDLDLNQVPEEHRGIVNKLYETAKAHPSDFHALCTMENIDELGLLLEQIRAQRKS